MESGSVIAEKLLPENAREPMEMMLSVSERVERGHPRKAAALIVVVELGMTTERRLSHPLKLATPI